MVPFDTRPEVISRVHLFGVELSVSVAVWNVQLIKLLQGYPVLRRTQLQFLHFVNNLLQLLKTLWASLGSPNAK